ncbi:hypothetical protein KIN20_028691 [Parelaphostrongylus tenuis]|uniref:Uncharacterized protein n=1 Tax=Parelaphostrongylus tenuis TaxID=148309 RepID=A0AAD5WF96_PARTN|nr:hypothetical protein KIN20_028691 [Parelaphostrongylus tenuis]
MALVLDEVLLAERVDGRSYLNDFAEKIYQDILYALQALESNCDYIHVYPTDNHERSHVSVVLKKASSFQCYALITCNNSELCTTRSHQVLLKASQQIR